MSGQEAHTAMLGGLPFDAFGSDRDASLVLEALAQGLCVCQADGQLVHANAVFRSYPSAIHVRIAELCKRAAIKFADKANVSPSSRCTYRFSWAKGRRSFEVVITPIPQDLLAKPRRNDPIRLVALIRDTSLQERMRRKMVAIDNAGSELVRLDAETIEKMHIAERLKLLESKVIRYAHELLHFDHFAVRLRNEKTNELELVMASGLSPRACSIKLYAEPENHGISGRVAATGEPYICADTSKDPLYVYGLDQAGSSLTVPISLFGKVIGVFNIESNKTDAFTHNDQVFAEIFGRYIGLALHILNLLLVERYTTNQKATGTVQGELSEPLNDLSVEAEALKDQALEPEMAKHVEKILKDVESIRRRVKNVARGPQTLLGADEPISTEIDPALEGKRILVVDNEDEIATTIRDVMTRRGCSVTVCNDGASAMKLLLQWQLTQDADQGFDLIISDINIGDATGYDVFASAKAASPLVPVVLMTGFGYDPHHSIVRASQEGLQAVLFKPFHVDKLVEEARRSVNRQG